MKNVLFIKIGALGDLSYALPAAQAFKKAFPCHLTWVVGKSYQSFLAGHRYIDKLVALDDKKLYSKNWFSRISELVKLVGGIRKRFDLVVIAHRDPLYYHVFNAFSRGATFQMVRGLSKDTTRFVEIPPLQMHESLAIKKLIETAITYVDPEKENIAWEWDYSHIEPVKIAIPKSFIALHLGGGMNAKTEFQLKCWPHWESLVLRLLTETNKPLVFVGSTAEEVEYKKIEEKVKQSYPEKLARCFNFMNNMPIRELVGVIQACDLFVGVDSGPLHIADSMNKPSIGLYGPTSPISWGLLSKTAALFQNEVFCSPCYKDDGIFPACHNEHRCMNLLEVEPVFLKITELLPKSEKNRLIHSPV